ncbi:MAG: endonuclease MutS2 [Filifactoraceae bacterium]
MNERSIRVLELDKIKLILENHCSSALGRELVSQLKPQTEVDDVIDLLKETSEAQSILLKKGSLPAGTFYDLKLQYKKASIGSTLDPKSLMRIGESMGCARRIKLFLKDFEEAPKIRLKAEGLIITKDIEDAIFNAIISEEEVSDNASPELKHIRKAISNNQEQIRSKINNIISSSSYSKYLQESIVTTRQDRFVVPVKVEYRSNFPGIVHDSSASGATLFIEPMAIVELNNNLRELRGREQDEIERILSELTSMVGEYAEELSFNQDLLAGLDFIMAKGKFSVEINGLEPVINQDKIIDIRNARHPLIDKQKVVPSNIKIGKDYKTLVITGPNTGGKTVSLKTVGLLCLMLQSGLHVPCDYGSNMCIFKDIYADIGDEQSIEQSLSTFSSHMNHIVKILEKLESDSLVLFDELGAGTDPLEGAALAIAILEKVKFSGALSIATTHYSELKNYALTSEGVENASVDFDVNSLSPTYRLLIGIPGKSNAFEISKKLGLNQDIINRAKTLLKHENIEMEEILKQLESQKKEGEKDRKEAALINLRAKALEESLKIKEEKAKIQKERILKDGKKEAQKLVKEAKEEADRLIKELRNLRNMEDKSKINKEIEHLRNKIKDSLGNLSFKEEIINMEATINKSIEQAEVGQEVFVPSFGKQGHILSIDSVKKEALVQLGIMKINLPFKALQDVKKDVVEIRKNGTGKILKEKTQSIKTEIDVRGMDLETAIVDVEKYLDNAYLSGIPRVTIIHGVGTGVLRKGINQWMRPYKHISYRDGSYGEGGQGVTIVEFK